MTPEIFRQQYPAGGLVSELAAIEHGQYIVRVLVQQGGVTLSSGLAAATSVEEAEDLARARALNLLGGTVNPVVVSSAGAVVPKKQVPRPASPTPVVAPVVKAVTQMPTPAPAPANEFKFEMPLSVPPDPEPVIEYEPAPEMAKNASTPPATGTVDTSGEALDFSDIIARSDVELKRLGWTSEQGRNYLLETYGKRSRQLLSDEELLEFLRYLESQSTP
ncbi:MAG: hypothetical protein HC799_06375 [Limnothrix sp. RL_2_0]|nr:hypothetical protein [Limnothrix sp. RL_2_0]